MQRANLPSNRKYSVMFYLQMRKTDVLHLLHFERRVMNGKLCRYFIICLSMRNKCLLFFLMFKSYFILQSRVHVWETFSTVFLVQSTWLSWLSLFNLCFKPLSNTFQKIQLLSSFIGQANINKQRNKIMAIDIFLLIYFYSNAVKTGSRCHIFKRGLRLRSLFHSKR